MSLITKTDIVNSEIMDFSPNIPDAQINPCIEEAELMDFVPIVPAAFYTDIQEVPSPTDELYTFRLAYVKPLLVVFALKRFIPFHGRTITQFGIRQINEETSTEITGKERGELVNDMQSKINVYLIRFWNALKEADYTFDGVVYDFEDNCNTKRNLRIRIKAV